MHGPDLNPDGPLMPLVGGGWACWSSDDRVKESGVLKPGVFRAPRRHRKSRVRQMSRGENARSVL